MPSVPSPLRCKPLPPRANLFARWCQERGSEPASFALLAPLVMFLVLGVMQLALALWVHTVLIDAAAAGAHAASGADVPAQSAERVVRQSLASTLGEGYVSSVEVSRVALSGVDNGFGTSTVEVIEVRLRAPVPLVGLVGIGEVAVVGHALAEVGPR